MFYIYRITNVLNGKIYIGKTVDTKRRWYNHRYDGSREFPKSIIGKAIKKHGCNNFTFDVIFQCTSEIDINWAECYFIQEYDSQINNNKGYNLSFGGEKTRLGLKASPLTRQRMREAEHPARFKPGKSASPETQFQPGQSASPATQFQKGCSISPGTQFKPGQSASPNTQFKKGISVSPMTEFKPGHSTSPQTQFKKGAIPHNKKLNNNDENQIIELHNSGKSINSIAKIYNIDWSSIKRVIKKNSELLK